MVNNIEKDEYWTFLTMIIDMCWEWWYVQIIMQGEKVGYTEVQIFCLHIPNISGRQAAHVAKLCSVVPNISDFSM